MGRKTTLILATLDEIEAGDVLTAQCPHCNDYSRHMIKNTGSLFVNCPTCSKEILVLVYLIRDKCSKSMTIPSGRHTPDYYEGHMECSWCGKNWPDDQKVKGNPQERLDPDEADEVVTEALNREPHDKYECGRPLTCVGQTRCPDCIRNLRMVAEAVDPIFGFHHQVSPLCDISPE